MKNVLSATTVCALLCITASAFGKDTLCEPKETTIFSCPVGSKIVSACASAMLTPTSGYVQYRFGRKNAIELAVPQNTSFSRDFLEANSSRSSGGSGNLFLRFKAGTYNYVLYQWWTHPLHMSCEGPCSAAGVVIEKNDVAVKNMMCTHRHVNEITPLQENVFERAGIPMSEHFPEDRD